MRITIHNVGHGSCISLVHDNGNVMLWDCGHDEESRPSVFLPKDGIYKIDRFFVTNYDEDHISDLPELRKNLSISILYRNTSISKNQLRALKLRSGPISIAMESMLDMIGSYTSGPPSSEPEFPGVIYTLYYNNYGTDFDDSNNISLVTFLTCNGIKLIIPGDLERAGWENLLRNASFCQKLREVNIFISSHHGRENGYCEEVFDYCKPYVIVFSDSSIKHATQQMSTIYANHARGIQFRGQTRYVLSTRNDGLIFWDV